MGGVAWIKWLILKLKAQLFTIFLAHFKNILLVKGHAAARLFYHARYAVHYGGLACAVWSKQSVYARMKVAGYALEHLLFAVAFG